MKWWLGIAFIITSTPVFSQDVCDIALSQRAFNTEESSTASSITFAKRDDLCNRSYNSLAEAQSSARKAGFNLGYGPLTIGASGAKSDASGRTSISDTAFCRSSAEDLSATFSSDFRKQVASVALNAWVECIRLSKSNELYMDYQLKDGGQYFTGTIYRTTNVGSLSVAVRAISALGTGKATVSCNIGGETYPPGVLEKRHEITEVKTTVACERGAEGSVSVAFQTTQDALPFIDLPSETESKQTKIEQVQQTLTQVKADLLAATQALDVLSNAYNGRLSEAVVAFAATSCPNGWETYEPAFGRFVRGLDLSGVSIDPEGLRSPGSLQDDSFKAHTHKEEGNFTPVPGSGDGKALGYPDVFQRDGKPTGQAETRPKNVALLFCKKRRNT